MDLEIGSLNQGGVIFDTAPFDLSPQYFTEVLNLDFVKDGVRPLPAPLALDITFDFEVRLALEAVSQGGVRMILLLGDNVVKVLYQDELYDVTPSTLTGTARWSYTYYNGYLLLANGINFPYYFDFEDSLSAIKPVPNWPESVIPKFISSFSGSIFGFGNILTSTFSEQVCIWSDLADIGSLPDDFNFADPASRAGVTTLPGNASFVAAVHLGNSLVVYRSADVYVIRFIGGLAVFSFSAILSDKSLLSHRSVTAKGRLHYCIDQNQFYVHDGISEQVFDVKPVSDFFYSTLNKDATSEISVVYDKVKDKLHILYPEGESDVCNKDLFYNFKTGTWSYADIPASTYSGIIYHPKAEYNMTYDDLGSLTFETWSGNFILNYPDLEKPEFLYFGSNLYSEKEAIDFRYSFGRRSLVAYNAQDQSGNVTVARNMQMLITDVWPKLYSGQIRLRFGYSQTPLGTIDWGDWAVVDEPRLDLFMSGVYLHMEFDNQVIVPSEEVTYSNFCLNGYTLTSKKLGDR